MKENSGSIRKENSLFNGKLNKAISIIINKCLGVKSVDSMLIIYDSKKEKIAKRFKDVSLKFTENVSYLKTPIGKISGEEPPKNITDSLLDCDVAIILTEKSMSHTKARRNATKKGVRIASMPGITEAVLRRSIDIDYDTLQKEIKKMASILNKGNKVRIKTIYGSELEFDIKGRKAHGLSAGIYNKKGKWGNLPEGEVFIAPVEGTAEGTYVVDGSVGGFGKLGHPIIIFIEKGNVKKITDGKKPPEIEKLLDRVGPKARNIAEFGLGLNKKAKLTGVVLEDEKAYGTCHIAFGNNIGFGGKTDVPLHIDCVTSKPDIWIDEEQIMRKGKLIV